VLRGVEGITFVQFDEKDVVRHTLVQRMVKAYDRYNEAIGAGRQFSLKLTEPPPESVSANTNVSTNGNGNGEVQVEIPAADSASQA
jgi:phosphate starvation-inducible PhoH-like protein